MSQAELEASSSKSNDPSENIKSNSTSKSKTATKTAKASKRPSPEEIEAIRAERASKKANQELEKEKAKQEALQARGTSQSHLDENGKLIYQPREWVRVEGCQQENPGVRIVSWKLHLSPHESRIWTSSNQLSSSPLLISLQSMLAQGLVRRKLFPGSDCLKWKDREAGLSAELIGHEFHVGLFQEVDRIESHSKTLQENGYSFVFEKGYKAKQHGLMIAWKSENGNGSGDRICFDSKPLETKVIYLDDLKINTANVNDSGNENNNNENNNFRSYNSRITRNIALFVVLKLKDDGENNVSNRNPKNPKGLILATTHLFWHPKHSYERVRQAGLIVKSLKEFRNQKDCLWKDFPIIFGGDFNDQPHSATYQLLNGNRNGNGKSFDDHAIEEIKVSSVIHQSVDDKSKKLKEMENGMVEEEVEVEDGEGEEEGEEEEDQESKQESKSDDQMLKNCRSSNPGELLSVEQLVKLYDLRSNSSSPSTPTSTSDSTSNPNLISCYNSSYSNLSKPEIENFFSSRSRGKERLDDDETLDKGNPINSHSLTESTKDNKEPMWTLFSSLFSLTLDYIFLFPNHDNDEEINGKENHDQNVGNANEKRKGNKYPRVLGLLRTHETKILEPGVPRLGVCASDHVLIGAEIQF